MTTSTCTICESLYADGADRRDGARLHLRPRRQVINGETCPVGSSAIAGMAFYPETGGTFPAFYRGGLFFADHNRNCIWFMPKGTNGQPDPAQRRGLRARRGQPGRPPDRPERRSLLRRLRRRARSAGSRPSGAPTSRRPPGSSPTPTSGPVPLTVAFDGTDLERSRERRPDLSMGPRRRRRLRRLDARDADLAVHGRRAGHRRPRGHRSGRPEGHDHEGRSRRVRDQHAAGPGHLDARRRHDVGRRRPDPSRSPARATDTQDGTLRPRPG